VFFSDAFSPIISPKMPSLSKFRSGNFALENLVSRAGVDECRRVPQKAPEKSRHQNTTDRTLFVVANVYNIP
jgi:hypothetical protein